MSVLPQKRAPWVLAIVVGAIGLVLLAGGAQLALLGGSLYYFITGAALVAAAVFLWRGRKWGLWLYAAMLGWTVIWALWEVGFDGWGLAARLIGPFVIGVWFLLPHVRKGVA
jgi:quinoprotein glucose dehydrogenase